MFISNYWLKNYIASVSLLQCYMNEMLYAIHHDDWNAVGHTAGSCMHYCECNTGCMSVNSSDLLTQNACNLVALRNLTLSETNTKFPAFYITKSFISLIAKFRHWSPTCASGIQSIYSYIISLKYISLLSFHLQLVFPNGIFHSDLLIFILKLQMWLQVKFHRNGKLSILVSVLLINDSSLSQLIL